jgi:hypothetical protein
VQKHPGFPGFLRYDYPMSGDLQSYLQSFVDLINSIIPVLFSLAFFFFIWNAARYFIFEGASEEGHEKAKSLALWGLAAFVILLSFWGLVNVMLTMLGINSTTPLKPDYF